MSKKWCSPDRTHKILGSGSSLNNKKGKRDRKIKLIDLCPEEKAKVGELMQLMEQEKQLNAENISKIKSYAEDTHLLKERIQELTTLLTSKQKQIAELSDRLGRMSEMITAKDVQMEQLTNLYERYMIRNKETVSTQTPMASLVSVAIQINQPISQKANDQKTQKPKHQKKHKSRTKHRNIKIQTEEDESAELRKKHSKSFERIMKFVAQDHSHPSNNRKRESEPDQFTHHKPSGKRINTFEPDEDVGPPSDKEFEEEMVKAWQSLKHSNKFSKDGKPLGSQARKKRVQFQRSREHRTSENRLSDLEYSEKQTSPTKLLEVYNQLRSLSKEQKADYDQEELNRMLKSGDFQARRALNSIRVFQPSHKKRKQHRTTL